MSRRTDARKRLSFLRKLYRSTSNPFRAITLWAKRRKKLRVRRFRSAQKFARQLQAHAQSAKARAKDKAYRFRMRRKVRFLTTTRDPIVAPTSGVGTFDGKQVAAWIIPWLEESRRAGWSGTVTSGYRSPEYSQSLCYAMCGAPSCPGRCAGTASNHSGSVYPAGAVDVTDYWTFRAIQPRIGSPLHNDLPIDPVHFSYTGH